MRRAALLFVLGMLGLAGCGEADPSAPDVEATTQGMYTPIRREVPMFGEDAARRFSAAERAADDASEIARRKRENARFGGCACADQRCAMLCLLEQELDDELGDAQARPVECLACGRETGFLPRPELRVEVIGEKTIRLSWDPIEGAASYAVHGMRWPDSGHQETDGARSYVWETEGEALVLTLETGSYSFSLVAWGGPPERIRSRPSLPVDVDI